MKSWTALSILQGLMSVSFVWTNVLSLRSRFTCVGGREEGDKWFDGCRWCVCQLDGPLCSPAACSDLVRQVPPCENVGSRWSDGCYDCTCKSFGIECKADRVCTVLMQSEPYHRQMMSNGGCVTPEDPRCVCGVDGVPSCTAEVIDRHAHKATTIALMPPEESSSLEEGENENRTEDNETNSVFEFFKTLRHLRRSPRVRRRSKNNHGSSGSSSYTGRRRFFNRFKGYYNYADREAGYPNHGYHHADQHSKQIHNHHDTHRIDRPHTTLSSPTTSGVDDLEDESSEYYQDGDVPEEYRQAGSDSYAGDESDEMQAPKSLLITTSNRCRYGTRWYGGSLRCYCDKESGSITCGDPAFVATRMDGFKMNKGPCEEGVEWHDEDGCQLCECKVNGIEMCHRLHTCSLPFLIKKVPDLDDVMSPYDSRHKLLIERRSEMKPDIGRPADDREYYKGTDVTDGSGEVRTINLPIANTHRPPLIIQPSDRPKYRNSKTRKHTMVYVTECNPGSRWLDGCRRCKCDSVGHKHCDDSWCLKVPMPGFRPVHEISSPVGAAGRPFQKPPAGIIRDKPATIKPLFPENNPCGRFRIGQRYLVKCNRCLCTRFGPKCTALNCGHF